MPSVQRFLSGRNNLVRTAAALAASSVAASTAIERTSAVRAGGGRVLLSGAYTGHEAAQVQVEVVAAGGIPRASVPQFVGVGNGQLAVVGVDAGAAQQTFTLTLADLGVPTANAGLDVREVRIRAKAAGDVGNSIRITVQPQLVRTATAWALLSDWSTGSTTQSGPQWDFGGLPLSAAGELDATGPRIQFGFDPQVYRPYRVFKDGEWRFGVSPELQRSVSAGTKVFSVTGGYVITVTNGTTTETYGDTVAMQPPVVSFHDLLLALDASALVEVAGVVAADRAIGGQAAIDVPLRTSAWLLSLAGAAKLQDVVIPGDAPTQAVTVRCINADVIGQERWSVVGDVSGELATATTGAPYVSAAALFTVPEIKPLAGSGGGWSFKYNPAGRAEGAGLPSVCVRPFRFGVNARPVTVTFRYSKRPPADCKCSDVATPVVSLKCLGIDGGDDMALDAEYQTRLQTLFGWRSDFMAGNTSANPDNLGFAKDDMDLVDSAVDTFGTALAEIYAEAPAAAEWDTALTEMQAELAWMLGLYPNAGATLVEYQGGAVNVVYNNTQVGRKYQVKAVRRDTVAVPFGPAILADAEGWTDPYAATWADDDTPFTISVTLGSVAWAFDYELWTETASDQVNLQKFTGEDAQTLTDERRTQFMRRYTARMDHVRTLAGIVPKSDPSSSVAGGCWVDHGGANWWVDTEGYYLPAFTNQGYVSARRNTETGVPYSTKEFGFGLVVACPERLALGDEITIRILQVDSARPYSVGDSAVLQTVGAGPAWLTGGVDGTDEQTWRVAASAAGALPDYMVPTDGSAAPTYTQAGVSLQLALGGIPYALGDKFSFAVEAGQYRWRKDGGAWAAAADIPATGLAVLADGLQATFAPGAAPSFVAGDAYTFAVYQPNAASHVQAATAPAWAWAGASASTTVDFGASQPLAMLAMARYNLPAGATATVQLSDDGATWSAAVALDVSGPIALHSFDDDTAARYLRVNVASATGGSIGWLWAGVPLSMGYSATSCQRTRRWAVQRGQGVNSAALYSGAGDGWAVGWDTGGALGGYLAQDELAALLAVVDWAQQHDEPLIFLPHYQHPQDAALVMAGSDALEVTDVHEYQPNASTKRMLSASLTLDPLYT
ncbi:discoidin domain-containing protein [Acidovorax sp. BL-A-41-H1]|uniref:discoidin domain-containing protein n=1 Tax=Acidovorax sp. BL-A-41-H1 TaxID=3421102 RepID=UPI003F798E0C